MSLNLDRTGWKRVRLGEVIRRSRRQVDPLEAGVQRYVAGGHINGDSITIDRWGHPGDGQMGSTFRYVVQPGQVIFVSARPYLRKIGVVDFSGVVADKTYVMDALPENGLIQQYLPFVLSSDPFIKYATAEATGSMNPRLLWGPLQRYAFDLPTIGEQGRIAELLWAIERHLVAMSANLKALRVARTAAIKEWLNSVSTWNRLSAQFEVQLGKMLSKASQPTDADPGVPYLANINVRWGYFDLSDLRHVRLVDREREKFRLNAGDILVCEGGEVGRAAIWDGQVEECYYQKALHRLRPTTPEALPGPVVIAFLELLASEGRLAAHSGGTTFTHLTRERLLELELPVASAHAVEEILGTLDTFERALQLCSEERAALLSLRSSLSAEIFGGD